MKLNVKSKYKAKELVVVYTSCLANYIPKARVLGKSLKIFHPDWKFILILGEPWPIEEPRRNNDPFDAIIYYDELGIPELKQWIFKHNIMEVCTAVKGFSACYLFEKLKANKVIYLDPDIQVFSSLEEVNNLLDTYDILLIPHHLKPQPSHMIETNELSQMRNGIFNLGFIAFADREEGISCARWWKDRLHNFCYIDVLRGLFTDQRWCDFIHHFLINIT